MDDHLSEILQQIDVSFDTVAIVVISCYNLCFHIPDSSPLISYLFFFSVESNLFQYPLRFELKIASNSRLWIGSGSSVVLLFQ